MSLINQMLRDLESRRSEGLERPGLLQDLAWSAGGGTRPARRRLIRTAGLSLLMLAVGVLGWRGLVHWLPLADDNETAVVADIAAAQEAAPGATAVLAAPPAPPAAVPRPAPVVEVVPVPEAQPEAEPAAGPVAAPEPAPAPRRVKVFKQVRPPSGAEQAARYYQRGYDYLLSQQYDEAERALRRALAADAGHIRAREMLVGQLIRKGQLAEAGELLRDGLSLAPRHAVFAKLYARLLVEQNAVPTAIHILQSARPPMAQDPEYHALLAALYQRQGNHRAAAGIYRELVRLRSDIGVWWVGLAVSLESLGKPAEARVAYEQARQQPRLAADLRRYIETRLATLEAGRPGS